MALELFFKGWIPLAAHKLAIERARCLVVATNVVILLQVVNVGPRLEAMNLPLRYRRSTRVELG
jgi:hypothetical protein